MSILLNIAIATLSIAGLAYASGPLMSKSITTQIEIDAPVAAVWQEFAKTDDYASWNPFITHVSGDMTVGNHLNVTIQPAGKSRMNFTPEVLIHNKGQELRWVGTLGVKGIFDGEHYFIFEETGSGTTILHHGETFRGMLAYVLYPLIGDSTENGFTAMNAALKARVEHQI